MQSRLAPAALALGLLALSGPSPAQAASPGGGSGGPSTPDPGAFTQERHVQQDFDARTVTPQQGQPSGFQVTGKVFDATGRPLSGIVVKLFTNGVILANGRTDVDGGFEIQANPMAGTDDTNDLWFQSPNGDDGLLDTNVVLTAGQRFRNAGILPPCVQKVDLIGNFVEIEVTMMTADEKKRSLLESGCLEMASTP